MIVLNALLQREVSPTRTRFGYLAYSLNVDIRQKVMNPITKM
jgi:hypothetical protein